MADPASTPKALITAKARWRHHVAWTIRTISNSEIESILITA